MSLRPPPALPGVPQPRQLPVLGAALGFGRDPVAFLRRLAREQGDVVQFTLAGYRFLFLNHPDAIEQVLVKHHHQLRKDAFYALLEPLLGKGLVTAEGELWKRNRKLCAPFFTPRHVETLRPTMERAVTRWVEGLPDAAEIDLFQEMMALTRQIVLDTLFGDIDVPLEGVSEALEVVMAEFIPDVRGRRVWLPSWVPTRGRRRARRAIAFLDELVTTIIAARRARGPGYDLLSQLLAARDEEGRGMDDRQLRDEVITMFAAGHETTATALTNTLLLLAAHPEEERALLADPSRSSIVFKESLRLMPPVWTIGRETVTAVQLGPHVVPPRVQIMLAPCVTHLDPRWWDEPEAFVPARWLTPSDRPRFAYFPFGGGPRICIGHHFALVEATLALERIVRAVAIVPRVPVPPPAIASVTLRPRGPVWVEITRRG